MGEVWLQMGISCRGRNSCDKFGFGNENKNKAINNCFFIEFEIKWKNKKAKKFGGKFNESSICRENKRCA